MHRTPRLTSGRGPTSSRRPRLRGRRPRQVGLARRPHHRQTRAPPTTGRPDDRHGSAGIPALIVDPCGEQRCPRAADRVRLMGTMLKAAGMTADEALVRPLAHAVHDKTDLASSARGIPYAGRSSERRVRPALSARNQHLLAHICVASCERGPRRPADPPAGRRHTSPWRLPLMQQCEGESPEWARLALQRPASAHRHRLGRHRRTRRCEVLVVSCPVHATGGASEVTRGTDEVVGGLPCMHG